MDAQLIKKAVAGLGTDESLLSEVLCTRSPTELKEAAVDLKNNKQCVILSPSGCIPTSLQQEHGSRYQI